MLPSESHCCIATAGFGGLESRLLGLDIQFIHLIYKESCGGVVALSVGRRTCDRQVAGSIPGLVLLRNKVGQVINTYLPLSPSRIIWF